MDKLRITVSDWPAGGQEFKIRLDGVFTVDSGGGLPLPLIGEVPVFGLSTREVSRQISESFRLKLGTILSPIISVEVVEFRPIYTVGVLERPGSYPYRPGMTVLHAVSLSGGFFRRQETDVARSQREMVSALGDLSLHKAQRDALLARKARLLAEIDENATIDFPAELVARKDEERVSRLMIDERKILVHRRATLEAGVNEHALIKATGQKQAVALQAQESAQERQLNIAKREFEEQSEIVAKGLTRRPVLFPIEQRIGDAEAKKRQLQSDQLRNTQDILRSEQAARELRSNYRTEALNLLHETEAGLVQIAERLSTANRLAQNAEMEMTGGRGGYSAIYTILRLEGGSLRERVVSELTEVLPGDIVRVTLQSEEQKGPASAQRQLGQSSASSLSARPPAFMTVAGPAQ